MNRTDARRVMQLVLLAIALTLLSGCGLLRGKPTPLPWLVTETPEPTALSQAEPTATATLAAPAITPASTETPQPTLTATTPPSPTPEPQTIVVEAPIDGAEVGSPIRLRGQARRMPFEGTLVVRVYDSHDALLVEAPIIATGELTGPATFEAEIAVGGRPGPGRIEVVDLSPRDGSVLARASVSVMLTGYPGGGFITSPPAQAEVTLPIRLLARAGTPGQPLTLSVSWQDGSRLTQVITPLVGLEDQGLVMVPVDFVQRPSVHPPTQDALIELTTLSGSPLASQPVRILAPNDPGTMATQVFWVVGEMITPQQIRIPRTQGIGRASLEALLWGPVPQNPEGYVSLLPSPRDVLTYPGRGPDWGERVRLQSLRIEDGVAYADFSIELRAHAGGALTTALMRQQIEATLTQFTTVDEVIITVNGMTGVLEP